MATFCAAQSQFARPDFTYTDDRQMSSYRSAESKWSGKIDELRMWTTLTLLLNIKARRIRQRNIVLSQNKTHSLIKVIPQFGNETL